MVLLAGCTKPAEPATTPAPAPAPAPATAPAADAFSAAPAAPTTQPSFAGIPAAAIAAAERAKARVETASTATLDNGAIFKQAQAFFVEKKYPEALKALDSIQAELLTPAQEKAVNDLRAQITQALELVNKAGGVGNLLGK